MLLTQRSPFLESDYVFTFSSKPVNKQNRSVNIFQIIFKSFVAMLNFEPPIKYSNKIILITWFQKDEDNFDQRWLRKEPLKTRQLKIH